MCVYGYTDVHGFVLLSLDIPTLYQNEISPYLFSTHKSKI